MTEERLERLLREAAREQTQPPETPRDEIWTRIAAARRQRAGEPTHSGPRRGPLAPAMRPYGLRMIGHRARSLSCWRWWPAAAAAALALGFIIGRQGASVHPGRPGALGHSSPQGLLDQDPTAAEQETVEAPRCEDRRAAFYAQAATPYLSRVEALLTLVRGADGASRTTVPVSAWARDLLAETRLLLDSPAQRDEGLRLLLTDLEFVLAQIVLLSEQPPARDSEWIRDSIRQRAIMGRLRGRIPAGQSGGSA